LILATALVTAGLSHAPAANAPAPNQSFELPAKDSPEAAWWRDSLKTRDERLDWWRQARFGMFVHWGVYSGLGNEYQGRRGGGYAEHIQRVLKIPIPEYRANVAGAFNPTNFNADEWIRLAKDAGMGYFVITAKHHDGFAMWPSRASTYNIMDATPWHHDPMKDLREACAKYGLKFGFYYSHAFDWGESNAPGNDWDYDNPGGDKLLGGRDWWETRPEFMENARRYVEEKAIPQLLELIHNYHPDILWFDTPHKLPPSQNLRILKAVREAAPDVVINGRLVRGWGDYESTADRPAEFAPHDGDWEGIPTTNESYGWNKFDHSHKPPSHFIRILAKAVARGGNLLMNIGPMGNGEIDPQDVAILKGIAQWWQANGESIRGCGRTPLPVQTWGESTRKENTLYLHVFTWPKDGRLIVGGLKSNVKSARMLPAAAAAPLAVRRLNPLDIVIDGLPAQAPDQADSVVAIECAGDIETDTARLLQPSLVEDNLRVFDAELQGRGLGFGAGKTRDAYITGLSNPDQSVVWHTRLNETATFEVELSYDGGRNAQDGTVLVSLGSKSLTGEVHSGTFQTVSLGRVKLDPGETSIKLAAAEPHRGELIRPRSLSLKPVAR
jgi:alpha-L-fucosidase